jgi:hypothetical protein
MLNLFALRATDPKMMLNHPNPEGPDNFEKLSTLPKSELIKEVVLCWGNHGLHLEQGVRMTRILMEVAPEKLRAFGWTKKGQPKHPLYLQKTAELEVVR